jgi:diguanylate cyclase (GGDEF)-like protein
MTQANTARSILIVEDNEGDIELVKIALADAGVDAQVRGVDRITAAIQALQHANADAVLLDMGLPDAVDLDGLHAIISHTPFTPIILLTGLSNQGTALQALERGAADYLIKGDYTPDVLARAILYAIERKKSELAMLGAARFDTVTGLTNRSYFHSLLEHAKRSSSEVLVLFLDLDHFKNINDSFGYAAGDELLFEVGARIQAAVRSSDVVARLGGDEFTVMIEDVDSTSMSILVANKILTAMRRSFHIAGVDLIMTPSIGIAGFPTAGGDAASLLQHADTAMYRVKSNGRNSVEFFSDEMGVEVREVFELELSLRQALQADEFELYYQPVIENQSGEIRSAEALLRWHRGGRTEPIDADEFIPMLESSGLIREVGEWVLRTAFDNGTIPYKLDFEFR